MTDFSVLTKKQIRALDRYPERREALEAAFRRVNERDRLFTIKIGLANDSVAVGGVCQAMHDAGFGRK